MKKTSIALTVGSILLIVGVVIGGVGFMLGGRQGFYADLSGFHAYDNLGKNEESRKVDSFDNIKLSFPSGNVTLVEADHYEIEYKISENVKINRMEVQDGTLYVDCKNNSLQFFNFILPDKDRDRITIYYPAGNKFNNLDMEISSGSISGKNLEAQTASLRQSSGQINLDGFRGDNLAVQMTSGGAELSNAEVANLRVKCSSGGMTLNGCTVSGELKAEMTSGSIAINDVRAEKLVSDFSSGNFRMNGAVLGSFNGRQTSGTLVAEGLDCGGITYQSTSGNVRLQGALKGENEIRITSGSATVSTSLPESEYSYTFDTSSGSRSVNGKRGESRIDTDAPNSFMLKSSSGSLNLNFAE